VEAGWVIEDLVLVSKVKVAGVGGVAVIDWLEELLVVVEAAGAAVDVFLQVPNLLGRQFVHDFPAFTQAQPLHKPDLLHLQHAIAPLAHHAAIFQRIVANVSSRPLLAFPTLVE